MTPIPPKTLILGGGISGLLAAWHRRAQGRDIELWEAASAVGGWARTLPWPGPEGEPGWLERGPQGLRFARNGALASVIQELNLALHPVQPKGPRWLGRGGRRCPSPATPAGLLQAPGLGLGARLRLLLEPFQPAGQDPDEHLQAFMARRFGPAFAREWLPALVAGVFAAPPERIGLDALPHLRRLDQRGGMVFGSLRSGSERTRQPRGGTGALPLALAARLGCVHLNRRAETLEPLPGGRWRVLGEGHSAEVDEVVLALPPAASAALLRPLSPEAALRFAAMPMLDLRVWHSRHAPVPGWERGFNLLIHPAEGKGLLGVVGLPVDDPRAVGGLLQVRSFLGGAYAVDPALESWSGVAAELRRWLPELPAALQVREEPCPGAFPLLAPGHGAGVAALVAALPPSLHWLGAARFGPGLADLAEGVQAWAQARQP
ncbi:MAG TPA: FAD-dependent oxidoreductase [Geothrix sp.]|nr:FAD-dependent oxidoreductase [Geothrix sp.]